MDSINTAGKLEAIDFLRHLIICPRIPGVMTIATVWNTPAWPFVTRPPYIGGLDFFSVEYGLDARHLGFWSRSHLPQASPKRSDFGCCLIITRILSCPSPSDEVVHGKRFAVARMPGDDCTICHFGTLLGYNGYSRENPAVMGGEFGQSGRVERQTANSIGGCLGQDLPIEVCKNLYTDLNVLHREPGLWNLILRPRL